MKQVLKQLLLSLCDFVIYSLIPLGFIFYDENNSYAFSFLLASFIGTSSSFLAAAWIIEKNKSFLNLRSNKSFFYSRGIAEGFETILFFAIMFIVTTKADVVKPNNGIEPYQVVKIQLKSLKNKC